MLRYILAGLAGIGLYMAWHGIGLPDTGVSLSLALSLGAAYLAFRRIGE